MIILPNYLFDLSVDRVDLVDEGACSVADIKLFKNKGGNIAMEYQEILEKLQPEHRAVIEAEVAKAACMTSEEDKDKLAKVETLEEELNTAKACLAAKEEELAKLKEESNVNKQKPEFEEVLKGLDPAVQEVFKSMKAQKEAAEAVAKAAQQAKLHEEAIAKAKELKALPVEESKLVDLIEKGISEEIHEILKAAANACEGADIFKSQGTEVKNSSSNTADSAWAKIELKADEVAKAKNISKAKAIDEVVRTNPDLYREYLDGGAN